MNTQSNLFEPPVYWSGHFIPNRPTWWHTNMEIRWSQEGPIDMDQTNTVRHYLQPDPPLSPEAVRLDATIFFLKFASTAAVALLGALVVIIAELWKMRRRSE